MSRSTSQSSSATTTTTAGHSRSLSVKTNNTRSAHPPNPIPASDVKLFVTNLRLLDLDLRPDWPNVTVQTLSARNADQRQRIGGVEWALFRLFEIWDPDESAQKLRPFFPPLEPLQSLNLRAALYRSLNELKKNGVLGRESVLRKTMLDECKGEKFFEVLALFSTAVLNKVLASQRDRQSTAIARTVSTAKTLSNDAQRSLLPLAIAHKVALNAVLKRKEEKRRRYKAFEAKLDAKKEEINARTRKLQDNSRAKNSEMPQKEADAIKKQLKDNWIGNKKWLDIILHGETMRAEDAFLNNDFDHVWEMVEQGRELEDADPKVGLLEDLQSRVLEQQTRLQKWQKFHEKLQQQEPVSVTTTKAMVPSKEFKFEDHLQLQLPSPSDLEKSVPRPALRPAYHDIISDMNDELSRVLDKAHNKTSFAALHRRGSSQNASRSPKRPNWKARSESIPELPPNLAKSMKPKPPSGTQSRDSTSINPPRRKEQATTTPVDSEATLVGYPSNATRDTAPAPQSMESPVERQNDKISTPVEENSDPIPTIRSSPPDAPPLHDPEPTSAQPPPSATSFPSEPPILEPPQLSHEDAMAEQIISSIGAATPSPIKQPQPRLSLADRTRMSMARTTSFEPITESPPPQDSPSLPTLPIEEEPPVPGATGLDRRTSLLDRTRLSMAAMTNNNNANITRASLAPNKDKKRQSRSRESLFPVNQFDTPRTRKSIHAIEEARSTDKEHTTPKEDLFLDEVDYERVFKSRPRIATSPVWSPEGEGGGQRGIRGAVGAAKGSETSAAAAAAGVLGVDDVDFDEGVTGVDLADVDVGYEDDDAENAFLGEVANSPSRRKYPGGGGGRRGNLFV